MFVSDISMKRLNRIWFITEIVAITVALLHLHLKNETLEIVVKNPFIAFCIHPYVYFANIIPFNKNKTVLLFISFQMENASFSITSSCVEVITDSIKEVCKVSENNFIVCKETRRPKSFLKTTLKCRQMNIGRDNGIRSFFISYITG